MNTFISFHDLTPEAHFLWASPAIFDLLGYEPEDLSGVGVYEIVFPEDVPDGRTAHKENVMNELVATQVVVRYKHKDGHFVHFLACFGLCYDFVLNVATMLDLSAEACKLERPLWTLFPLFPLAVLLSPHRGCLLHLPGEGPTVVDSPSKLAPCFPPRALPSSILPSNLERN